jgi:hypothetical protein
MNDNQSAKKEPGNVLWTQLLLHPGSKAPQAVGLSVVF